MFANITAIKRANKGIGHHFFSKGALRFFNSTVYPRVYGGRFFVTSEFHCGTHESHCGTTPVRYTVRGAQQDGAVKTVSEFQEFATKDLAITFAKGL